MDQKIQNLFGSQTRYKLIKLFILNPDGSFYVREITRIIDEQINSVRRELANLNDSGIVLSKNKNNKLYYFLDKKNKLVPGLESIFRNSEQKYTTSGKLSSHKSSYKVDKSQHFIELAELSKEVVIQKSLLEGIPEGGLDIFCIVRDPSDKVSAIEYLRSIENEMGSELGFSVLTEDQYDLNVANNKALYDRIYSEGVIYN